MNPTPDGRSWRTDRHRLARDTPVGRVDLGVDTWNAEVNDRMNAVNEALVYRSIETSLELQKKLQP